MNAHVEQLVDLTDPASNEIYNCPLEEARRRVGSGDPAAVAAIEGSFGLVARDGKTVRLARSLDRPLRYFLAKRAAGPALVVADRIDTIHRWLQSESLEGQFHPSYTRMVPAHFLLEIQLVGCPDPDPTYTRFFQPAQDTMPANLDQAGFAYIQALQREIDQWLRHLPAHEPVGVSFSGGIDSGAVFLLIYTAMQKLGLNLARLKAFTLDFGAGQDVEQARAFLTKLDLALFHEAIEADRAELDVDEAIRVVEDYKPLDIACAAMGLALCRGIRRRYPDWKYLADGDGGDENLKDYPIEENPELTVRSVINNSMLYQEGWGVGKIKHSLTYSGGLSRSYCRTYAPAKRCGFMGFSPYTRPNVVAVAEGLPYRALTNYDVDRLYALKGEVVARGLKAVTGWEMPVFPKRRFQHGAMARQTLDQLIPAEESELRRRFLAAYQ